MPSDRRGLPRRPIFWTIDQVADMLSISVPSLVKSYLWFDGKEIGPYHRQFLRASNLAVGRTHRNFGDQPSDWRIAEPELLRWMKFHRLYLFDEGDLSDPLPNLLPRSEQRGTLVDVILDDELPARKGTEEE